MHGFIATGTKFEQCGLILTGEYVGCGNFNLSTPVLGKDYFDLARAIYRAHRFDDLVDLLAAKLPALIGGGEAVVMGVSPVMGVCSISNHGPIARRLGERMDDVNRLGPGHPIASKVDFSNPGDLGFTLSDHVSPERYQSSKFVREIFGDIETSDVIIGMMVQGEFRMAYLNCYLSKGVYGGQARERFDAILLTVRGVLDRMESANVEMKVRQRIFMARADTQLALFILKNGEVVPINYAAVQLGESWWMPDEPARQLGEELNGRIHRELADAWENPVTSVWKDISFDLGGGEMKFHALPKLNGEVILMVPASGAEEGEDLAAGILTKRQREIMDWVAEGKTSAEAAIILNISPRTVEKHLEAVFQRLGVENRIAAVRRYLDLKRGI